MPSHALARMPARLLIGLLLLAAGGCAPRLAPLYHDYEILDTNAPVEDRIEAALAVSGWTVAPSTTPNLIVTEERAFNHWGLYQIRASLEVSRLGDDHVRVFIHPYRRYITGGRSKIPYLKRNLRSQVLPDLTRALKERGIHVVGTPIERDRVALTQ